MNLVFGDAHEDSGAGAALPERPRLRRGCSVFEDGEELLIRSIRGAFRIESAQRAFMQRLLSRLDGTRDFVALLDGESTSDAFYALRILDELAHSGLLIEGAAPARLTTSGAGTPMARPESLRGVELVLLDTGPFATALTRHLIALGASVRRGDVDAASACNGIALSCLDSPDPSLIERTSAAARRANVAYLPVFPFGDALLVGPSFAPEHGPCWRCFELRWLGISPSIAGERAYLARLRRGATTPEPEHLEQAEPLAVLAAAIISKRLANDGSAARLTLVELEAGAPSEVELAAHPQCPVCSQQALHARTVPDAGWNEPPLTLEELAPRLEPLVSDSCGLVSIVRPPRSLTPPGSGLLEVVVSRFAFPEPEGVDGAQSNFCHGAAPDARDARTLAIIEAIERYNGLSTPPPGVRARYRTVTADAVLPTELPLFSDAQYASDGFPFQPFSPEQELCWTWAQSLTRKRRVLVPTSAVYYGYDDALLGECSSGVAAHSSRGHALLNGLCELVERDAFMIHWLNRLSPPKLDGSRVASARSQALVRGVQQAGYDVELLDLTTDLEIPVVLALGIREDRKKPALLVGAGASLHPLTALERALSELYSATLSRSELWTLKPAMKPSEVRTLADHSRAYEHPDWLPRAAFLWASERSSAPPFPDEKHGFREHLATLLERLEARGHEVIAVDITASDVARLGLFVIRALALGLQPLALGPGARLGGRRWREAPVRMGHRAEPANERDLNPYPHCFP